MKKSSDMIYHVGGLFVFVKNIVKLMNMLINIVHNAQNLKLKFVKQND